MEKSEVNLSPPRGRPLKNSMRDACFQQVPNPAPLNPTSLARVITAIRTMIVVHPYNILLALLQKLVGEFFLILGREIWREFAGFFLTHEIKAQNFRGKIRSIFREKIRASKKIFRANFVLQPCRPNITFILRGAAEWLARVDRVR